LLKTGRLQVVSRHIRLHGKAVFAALLVALVLLLDAMAACPSLHELVHQDANTSQHQCAVTLFAHGQVDSASVDVSIVVPPVPVETAVPFEFSVFSPAISNLPAGRAPPVSVSSPA
jgi:hypothetical protein